MKKPELVIVNNDLDGAGCFVLYTWVAESKPVLYEVTQKTAEEKIRQFFDKNSFSDFSKITILGVDVSGLEGVIDSGNVFIITAHKAFLEKEHDFKLAKVIAKEDGSSTRLTFSLFKKGFKYKPTEQQKLLVVMIDDAVSRNFALQQSKDLETLFWNKSSYSRVLDFHEKYNKGFFGFDKYQKNQLVFLNKKCDNVIRNLQLFTTKLPIKDKIYNFFATFADCCFTEISDELFENYNADVIAIVNTEANRVYFRRSKVCEMKLDKLAKKLCNGDGYKYAASGEITEKFLNFTKLLKPYVIN